MSVDFDKLTKAFPESAHKSRRVQGKELTYVEGHTVIHRLNDATGNNWSMEIKSIDTIQIDESWKQVTAHVALTIPGLGTREHIGIQDVHVKGPDLVKGAITDALKKAATLFGVGLELYGPDYEAGEMPQPQQPRNVPAAGPPAQATPSGLNASGRSEQQASRPAASTTQPISEKQINYLWALAKERGLSEDDVHTDLKGKRVHELSKAEASNYIDYLAKRPVANAAPPRQQPIADIPEEPAHIANSMHWQ